MFQERARGIGLLYKKESIVPVKTSNQLRRRMISSGNVLITIYEENKSNLGVRKSQEHCFNLVVWEHNYHYISVYKPVFHTIILELGLEDTQTKINKNSPE